MPAVNRIATVLNFATNSEKNSAPVVLYCCKGIGPGCVYAIREIDIFIQAIDISEIYK
jgi:hypothetical protein